MSAHTIYALATPAGKSGVAVIRLSGPQATTALEQLTGRTHPAPNSFYFSSFYRPQTRELIDRGLALYFKAPQSFTGEDVVELHTHGSLAVIREMLETLSHIQGLRPAEAGEFTRRAFTHGKMDLTEAEGLADLIEASTSKQKSQAMRQMEGHLSRYYGELRQRMLLALAHMEAYIDFPDEEIPESVLHGLTAEVDELKATIESALRDDRRGQALREGLHIVILGAPNAGKSSLLNTLAQRDAAIVSQQAGTTRDVIEVHLDIAGFPVILTDTAGLRESDNDIEAEGIRRAMARAQEADIKLVIFDASLLPQRDKASLALIDERSVIVYNKSDKASGDYPLGEGRLCAISTANGQGIDVLLAILTEMTTQFFAHSNAPMITRDRHKALLSAAYRHLSRFDIHAPLELTCEELRQSALCLGKITGKIEVDDVLDVVFRQFCIGK
jgi:tRNA modification GTPase